MITPLVPSSTAGLTDSNGVPIPKQTLDQGDFLKLLVAQMSSQDPLDPQKDTDFIAQMAQFSSLEQSKTMQSDMAGLRSDQQLLQANSLLGRTVTLDNGDETLTTGVVSSVQIVAGTPAIMVNGKAYDLSQLSAISPTPVAN